MGTASATYIQQIRLRIVVGLKHLHTFLATIHDGFCGLDAVRIREVLAFFVNVGVVVHIRCVVVVFVPVSVRRAGRSGELPSRHFGVRDFADLEVSQCLMM